MIDTYAEGILFEFDAGCEAMVWSANGHPLQGLTGGDGVTRRAEFPLAIVGITNTNPAGTFYLELACNGLFGVGANGMINPPDPNRTFTVNTTKKPVFECIKKKISFSI